MTFSAEESNYSFAQRIFILQHKRESKVSGKTKSSKAGSV